MGTQEHSSQQRRRSFLQLKPFSTRTSTDNLFFKGVPGTWRVDNINCTEIWSPFSFIMLHWTWTRINVIPSWRLSWIDKDSQVAASFDCAYYLSWLDFYECRRSIHLSSMLWRRRSPGSDAYPFRSSFANYFVSRHATCSLKSEETCISTWGSDRSRTNMSQYNVKEN